MSLFICFLIASLDVLLMIDADLWELPRSIFGVDQMMEIAKKQFLSGGDSLEIPMLAIYFHMSQTFQLAEQCLMPTLTSCIKKP